MNIHGLLKKNKVWYFFIFLLSTSFIFFCLHSIPIGIMWKHDYNYITPALETTYLDFFQYIFMTSPPTLSNWCEDVQCLYYRPAPIFLSKILYEFNGLYSTAFYFSRAIMVGMISTIIFYFLELTTKRKTIAFFGAFFFTTLPPIFSTTWILGDVEIIAEFFMMCALLSFYKSIYTPAQEDFKKKIMWVILFTVFSILAIRSKETVKPFFGIIIIMSMLFYRRLYRYFLIPFLLICYYIIPRTLGNTATAFSFYAIYIKTIASPGFDYPTEVPTLFSLTQHFKYVPSAMLSQVGFLFGWFVLLSVLFIIIMKWKEISFIPIFRRIQKSVLESEKFALYIMLMYFPIVLISLGFLLPEVEHRYFVLGLIPFTFILFISLSITSNLITSTFPKIYKYYMSFFILFAILCVSVNAYHITYDMRGGTIDFFKGPFEATKIILTKDTGVIYSDIDLSEITNLMQQHDLQYIEDFFASKKGYQHAALTSLNYTYSISNNYYLRPFNSFNETLISNNTFYIITRGINASPITLNASYTIQYVTAAGGCFDSSMYCIVKNKLINPKRTFFIYEVKENIQK